MKSSEEIVSSESTSKPIKKRVVNDDGAGDDDNFGDYHGSRSSSNGNYSVSSDTSSENISYESKARKELSDFLENKGLDASREMVGYRVLLQHSKNRRLPAGTFSVTYSGPDGDISIELWKEELSESIVPKLITLISSIEAGKPFPFIKSSSFRCAVA